MKVSFDWVNGGESFELPGLPIAGQDELIRIGKQHQETKVLQFQATRYNLLLRFVTTHHILAEFGLEKAMKHWKENMVGTGIVDESYDWPEDKWPKKFGALYDEWVVKQLGTDDHEKIKEEVNKIGEGLDMDRLATARFDHETQSLVCELYWRLKRKFKEVNVGTLDEPEMMPLSQESLRQVAVYPDDYLKLRDPGEKVDIGDLVKPKSAKDIEKN